ncbi:MAG: (Fe-S)-binding protein [Proteobacteria bacterium]|nr:(Fe-S)-binding protein [Pseudomonadota bacterium]
MKPVIFVILLAGFVGYFGRTMWRMARAASRGSAEPRPRTDQLGARLMSVLVYFFGQKKVAEEGPQHMSSKHHLFIFWGFLIITIASAEIFVNGVVPAISLQLLPDMLFIPLKTTIDVFNLIVLVMVSWAIFRRVVVQPRLIPMNLDAGLILGGIASLMITHFLFHGFHGAVEVAAGRSLPEAAPVSNAVAAWLMPIRGDAAVFGAEAAYWLHVAILLTFLNYLPYSKHIHLLGALPNIFTRNLSDRRMDLPKLDLEDENQWGVGRFEQFSWKSLLDTYACTECARCSNYCPAYNTEKNLSPMQLIHDIRYEMLDRDALYAERDQLKKQIAEFAGDDQNGEQNHKPADLVHLEQALAGVESRIEDMPPMLGGRIADDTLWACTTCGACQEVCPVFIEHPVKIIQMRQSLVMEEERVPAELARTFRNLERMSNPWGIPADQRMDWAEGLDVPTIEDKPDPEYILWVGCAGAFDNRIVKQTKSMVKILAAAGVDYAVLGHQEGCTGDPARRAGNELLFQMQAEANIETLNQAGAKKVITSCPHCLHTLRHDYPHFGGDYQVIHHTQLIAHLVEDGKLAVDQQRDDKLGSGTRGGLTYHDSCYLGRWNREFDAPRAVLNALPASGRITELGRSRRHGLCCGAGGGRMFMEEDEPRVNLVRTDEILDAGVDTVAVACPFCNIMLTDGMKQRDKEDDVKVVDVAELVAERLIPASSLVRQKSPDEA